jgi:hypothetical protein
LLSTSLSRHLLIHGTASQSMTPVRYKSQGMPLVQLFVDKRDAAFEVCACVCVCVSQGEGGGGCTLMETLGGGYQLIPSPSSLGHPARA